MDEQALGAIVDGESQSAKAWTNILGNESLHDIRQQLANATATNPDRPQLLARYLQLVQKDGSENISLSVGREMAGSSAEIVVAPLELIWIDSMLRMELTDILKAYRGLPRPGLKSILLWGIFQKLSELIECDSAEAKKLFPTLPDEIKALYYLHASVEIT